jgi:hypothetical protein
LIPGLDGAIFSVEWRDSSDPAEGAKILGLSVEEKAIIVAFRRHTFLPLDNCLYALQATLPHLTRSSLPSLLATTRRQPAPGVEGDKTAKKKKFKSYAIGFFHVDMAEVRTKEGNLQVARPSSQLRRRLQFRPQAQDPQRPLAIRVHQQMLDFGPEKTQPGSTPSNARTKHLMRSWRPA